MRTGKLLGIDHGIKRIGLAISDPLRLVARELVIIKRKSRQEDFDRLNQIVKEQGVIAVVVGLPTNDHIEEGIYSQADTVKLWVERYSATTTLPIILWDEQLTSQDAQEIARLHKRRMGEPIDDLAARVILQSYLDALRDGLASLPVDET